MRVPKVVRIQYSCSQTALRRWLASKSLSEEKLASSSCSGCLREQLFHQPDASAALRNAGQGRGVCCQKKELANGTRGGLFVSTSMYSAVLWANGCSVCKLEHSCLSCSELLRRRILFVKAFAEESWEDRSLTFHLLLIHQRKYCIEPLPVDIAEAHICVLFLQLSLLWTEELWWKSELCFEVVLGVVVCVVTLSKP